MSQKTVDSSDKNRRQPAAQSIDGSDGESCLRERVRALEAELERMERQHQRHLQLERHLESLMAEMHQQREELLARNQELTRSRETLDHITRAYRVQASCNHALLQAGSEAALLTEVCRLIVEQGRFRLAWVGLVAADEACSIQPAAFFGKEALFLTNHSMSYGDNPYGQGPSGRAVRERRPVVCQDIASSPIFSRLRADALAEGLLSCISLPLIVDERCLGVLGIYSDERRVFDAEEVELLVELARQLAFGLEALRARTERSEALEQVRRLAYFDPLTELPNRRMFLERLEQAIAQSERESQQLALLFLDLDRFKDVNDTLGHEGGDALLAAVGRRLRGCVRQADTVARLGGDEFVVILHPAHGTAQVETVAKKIIASFDEPFSLAGNDIHTGTSIGIARYPADGTSIESLLRHADAAMYQAKADGRRTYRFFSAEMNRRIQAKLTLEQHLREAWARGEMSLHYQPQMLLRSGEIVGVEALLRWYSPVLGEVAPDRFIPLAEETGMLVPLSEWVLHTACRQMKVWHEAGYDHLRLSVNISARVFHSPGFVDSLDRMLAQTGLPPNRLMLEMTESTVMEKTEMAIMTLTDLKVRGVMLSLDDFGTGYSSLNHLRSFPIDQIKIDRSFLADFDCPFGQSAIIEAMIAMAHSLGIQVVAEGVEEQEQVDFLLSRHCDEVQGFYWEHPLPAIELLPHLRSRGRDTAGGMFH
ncbi:putative bifunctional diguanylate cyclase/phosphodiesterase [Geoalkalibacter subterraneus]|uniref:putative bifunctional diguanylate cyclase/phosphodiesterase n=1 Tax=Geoalkalibacter subterraneus TaxID=483547 RepID=UPI0006939FDE|nr:EAL domain-containing protein [Geoalkalibacter subterraneus]